MRPLPGGDLNARNTENPLHPVDFNSAPDFIVVGDSYTDTKFPGPFGDLRDAVITIRMAAVKMEINHRMIFRQCRQIRFFNQDSIYSIHYGFSLIPIMVNGFR